jgi:hypothetical protein
MPLGVTPNLLIIPPQLALVAKQILQSTTMVATGPGQHERGDGQRAEGLGRYPDRAAARERAYHLVSGGRLEEQFFRSFTKRAKRRRS